VGLTYDEVGEIVDASPRSVARWTAGKVVPQKLNKQRLLELAYVADAVTEVLPRDQANMWMFAPNRLLAHRKPADLMREGGISGSWRSSMRWPREYLCDRCLEVDDIFNDDWSACQAVGHAAWFLHMQGVLVPAAGGVGLVITAYEQRTRPGQLTVRESVDLTPQKYRSLRRPRK
jgi:hypothetical protein